jgi:transcription initiation factor TFIIIB Brf1 subunit/transcription initiation factor TFIIB
VPVGRDPYPIAEALQKQVEEATAENARQAEAQWTEAGRSPQSATPAAASVSLRPVASGVEITVRYITRVADREELRGKLYHTAVDMLGGAKAPA